MYTTLPEPQGYTSCTVDQPEGVMICLLGSFRLVHRGKPINALISGKALALLTELALRLEGGVAREALLETLWPGQDPSQSIVSLNSLVYSLQRHLKAEALEMDAPVLRYVTGRYVLNTDAGVSTDITRFDADVKRGTRLAAEGAAAAVPVLQRAVDLYRGDLNAGPSVYAVIERERLRVSYLRILAWLATNAYHSGDDVAALDYALKLLAAEPCREDAHRLVMRVHMRHGERAQAMRQFQICTEVLRSEFDVAPEDMTRELFDQIRSGAEVT
jgi:DNA-binding SARP family transcriptional activator